MLKAEGKINDAFIENMMHWLPAPLPARRTYSSERGQSLWLGEHHSGFNVYCGDTIWPHNQEGLENLARGTCPP